MDKGKNQINNIGKEIAANEIFRVKDDVAYSNSTISEGISEWNIL
jgi:hypothetical protein